MAMMTLYARQQKRHCFFQDPEYWVINGADYYAATEITIRLETESTKTKGSREHPNPFSSTMIPPLTV